MNERILIIEDEAGLVPTISDLLVSEGYRVDNAQDGETGLSKTLHEKFALVIVGVMLPKKTGFDVCRECGNGALTAAILLTALDQLENLEYETFAPMQRSISN